MDRPIVVVVDCCRKSASSDCGRLVSELLGDQNAVPASISYSSDTFDVYPLRLETKYYTSDVGLCVVQSPTIGDKEFANAVEAVVLFHSDSVDSKESFCANVDRWLSFIRHWEETSVRLLVCNRAPSELSCRSYLQQWCLKNDFELVELSPDEESLSEADDCGEVTGVKRILQGLKAHSWSNLVMKDERVLDADRAERLQSFLQENDQDLARSADVCRDLAHEFDRVTLEGSSAASASVDGDQRSSVVSDLHSNIDKLLGSGVRQGHADHDGGDPGCGGVSFEELFGRFAEMKEMAASLPFDQRKAYAEKVTVAFWRAIGGDENEIAGVGDSSDDDDCHSEEKT